MNWFPVLLSAPNWETIESITKERWVCLPCFVRFFMGSLKPNTFLEIQRIMSGIHNSIRMGFRDNQQNTFTPSWLISHFQCQRANILSLQRGIIMFYLFCSKLLTFLFFRTGFVQPFQLG
jgi:hypothetical protein